MTTTPKPNKARLARIERDRHDYPPNEPKWHIALGILTALQKPMIACTQLKEWGCSFDPIEEDLNGIFDRVLDLCDVPEDPSVYEAVKSSDKNGAIPGGLFVRDPLRRAWADDNYSAYAALNTIWESVRPKA